MDHYLDIRIRPDPEFPPAQLMNALFGKLHRVLAQLGSQDIGLSFPDALPKRGVGRLLRLHGNVASLERLMAQPWLGGAKDHADIGDITVVPTSAGHLSVRRVQAKSSAERLRRRLIKRKGISAEQALAAIPDSAEERLELPYLIVVSQTTGQRFRIFLDQRPVMHPVQGQFNAYGLSATATLPNF